MNFNSVILKNLKSNIRYYLAYFLCIAFSISFFFMLVNLINDYNLKTAFAQSNAFTIIVSIPLFVLSIFSMIFISYVNKTLVNAMSKELGLFLALGIDKKKISKIVLIQNIVIGVAATAFGLFIGTVFSRLLFIIILKILNLSNVPFGLHLKSYIYTILMFFTIFLYLLIKGLFIAKKVQVNELLKESRKKEDIGFKSPIWGIIGLIILVSINIVLFKYVHNEKLGQIIGLMHIIFTCIGLSLLLSQSHNLLAFISKRSKAAWYKNLIFNTNFRHRISSNKKFIFALTIAYFAMFDFGIIFYHEYHRVENVTKQRNAYDFLYFDIRENKIESEFLKETINKEKLSVTSEKTLQILEMSMDKKSQLFMYDENFNEVFNNNVKDDGLKVAKGKAVALEYNVQNANYKKDIKVNSIKEYNEIFTKNVLGNEYSFIVDEAKEMPSITNHDYRYIIDGMYVISKDDFYNISKEKESKSKGAMYYFNFKDWKDAYKVENELDKLPENFFSINMEGRGVLKISKAFSILGKIKQDKAQHGLIFFLFSFICAIFFMACGSLIYFKYFSQLDNEKRMYKKLKGIGITHKEIKKMLSEDMLFIFFIPCILGYLISAIKSFGFYPSDQRADLLNVELKVLVICLILQIIYYLLTRKKVYDEIVSSI